MHSLERGARSERALNLEIAVRYLQGVSTRCGAAMVETLCGKAVSVMRVSRAARLLADKLEAWRTRTIGGIPLGPLTHSERRSATATL